MNKCPKCKSKRINAVPGYTETGNKKTYYCMKCDKEYDSKGKELSPIL